LVRKKAKLSEKRDRTFSRLALSTERMGEVKAPLATHAPDWGVTPRNMGTGRRVSTLTRLDSLAATDERWRRIVSTLSTTDDADGLLRFDADDGARPS
jgi:hypothetical protein